MTLLRKMWHVVKRLRIRIEDIQMSGPWFQDFKVEPEELQPLLKDYVQLRKDGLF